MLFVYALAVGAALISVWAGVYTTEQATRGADAYQQHCGACHGEDLRGSSGRPLVGDRFWQDWNEDRLSSLFRVMQQTMPRARPHSLEEGTYADIVAFILKENGFPAGARELTGAATAEIQVTRKEGPGPAPNFSLITVVGCLTHSAAAPWAVTRASAPIRTRNPEPSQEEERSRAEGTELAENTFELMDADSAAAGHDGRRAEVKGLLIRGTPDKINVTSIQFLAGRCER